MSTIVRLLIVTRSKVTRSAALAQRRSLLRLCFDSAMGDWLVAGGSRKKSASRTSKEDAARTQHTELVRNFKTSLCTSTMEKIALQPVAAPASTHGKTRVSCSVGRRSSRLTMMPRFAQTGSGVTAGRSAP